MYAILTGLGLLISVTAGFFLPAPPAPPPPAPLALELPAAAPLTATITLEMKRSADFLASCA